MRILISITTLILTTQAFKSPPRIEGVATIEPREDSSYYRLPENVIPSEYTLLLEPFLLNDTFNGNVVIKVDVVEETDTITFHAAEIEFIETVVTDSNGSQINIESETDEEDRDFRVLYFGRSLPVGEYTISISYVGLLNGHNDGFYRSNYTKSNGEFVRLATTQFEATSARYAFPCFDEPALKANFLISIVRDANYNSISNMPLRYSTILSDGRFLDEFSVTPKMPTYLVAFIVSDFTYVKNENDNHRVYARPDYISSGDGNFALEVGSPILEALEEYTKVPYSLEKMYQISLPHFSAGAMENWGLVTYRETALMYNKSTTTTATKQSIEVVIAHEFVHQWFGDLVGPKWWSYLWLNEGFASFLQYEIGGKVKPQWRLSEQLLVANSQSALSVDASATTRPMTYDAGSPREISNLFDTIAYGKSGAVLRMLQHAIGEEAFREGLRIYLTNMAYKPATGDDLWNAIQTAIEADYTNALPERYTIPEIMSTWEFQGGFPLVTVTRNYTNGRVAFSQKRFIFSNPNSELNNTWYVPINYATASSLNFDDTTATNWIVPESDLVLNLNINADDFLIINKQFSGYYRTTYDEENWNLIADYLDTDNFEQIPPLTRAILLNDAFVLARANRVRYGIALNLAKYLHRETDYIPLKSLFNELGNFNQLFRGLDNYYLLEARFAESFEAAVSALGAVENEDLSDDEEHLNTLNRIQVLQWACLFGNELCRRLTTERLNDPSAISLDLRSTVLCAGIRGANASVWNYIYERSLVEEDSSLKSSLTNALGCSENDEILNSYVEQALAQRTSIFSRIYSQGNYGIRYTLNYISNNLSKIYDSLGVSTTGSLIRSFASYLRSPSQLAQLQELNRTNTIEELTSDLVTAIATAESYVATTAPFNDEVESWINSELGSNDDGDGGNDDDDDDDNDDDDNDDDEGSDEGSENGSAVKEVAFSVGLAALLVQRFIF